jgi:hypothetical protein
MEPAMTATTDPRRSVTFDAADGSIIIDGLTTKIGRHLRASEFPFDLAAIINSRRELVTGWTWVNIGWLELESNPCRLSLGFIHDHLSEVSWSLRVAGAEYTRSWPSPDAVAKELHLVARILAHAFGPSQVQGRGSGESTRYRRDFAWGCVWCELDPRAGTCASGLRYATP